MGSPVKNAQRAALTCSYEEAHNRVWGSVAYAEEAGIAPDKSFRLTQYMLDEDTDDETIEEYFENEALSFDHITKNNREKGMRLLHDYVDHIPRWTLKGHARVG